MSVRTSVRKVLRTGMVSVGAVFFVSGCATFDIDDSLSRANDEAASFTGGELELAMSDEQRAARAESAMRLLADPLDRDAAVRLALVNSPALQAMLAEAWAEGSDAAQGGRIPNPVFAFERLASDSETEIERTFALGLVDVLSLPWRTKIANRRIERTNLVLVSDVVGQVTEVRQAWVEAVAAAQDLGYAEDVRESAASSSEMARRLEGAGNFSRLERVREQVFYADTTAQLASVRHEARAARERLVRLLGLDEAQADALKLPEQLPDIPEEPMPPEAVADSLNERRIDVRLAKADLDSAAKAQGLGRLTTFTDIELAYRNRTVFPAAGGDIEGVGIDSEFADGYEITATVPLFDWGGMERAALNARTLAAANRYQDVMVSVGSNLRENYSAYRTSHDVAKFYREEILPLRELISEENVLQYNGMLISVFELLADSRASIGAVQSAIRAQRQFWLAEAALQASLVGRPTMAAAGAVGGGDAGGGEAH